MGDNRHVYNTIGSRFAIYAFPHRCLKNAYVTLADFVVDPAALPRRMAAQAGTWVTAFTGTRVHPDRQSSATIAPQW
jgi:hypothetical protein